MFQTYIYNPILSVLIFLYQNIAFHDLGIAIILLTILVRLVLFPFFQKGAKDQALMAKIQPHIKKIQEEFKNNKEEQAKKLMGLYKEHKFNPFSGILLLIVQLPIFIALFKLFSNGLSQEIFTNTSFLNMVDLGQKSLTITFLAAIVQYWQAKVSMPKGDGSGNQMQKMMLYMGPAMTFIILTRLPSALGFYWLISGIFSVFQQLYINKKQNGTNNRTNQNII